MTSTPVTVEEYLQLRLPADARISPDGQHVVYVVGENGKEGPGSPERCQIWLAPSDGIQAARQLTFGPCQDRSPRWSPRGDRLAFLSDREKPGKGSHQICLLAMDGGEAVPLTKEKGSIADLAWCRDGIHIAFLMTEPAPEGQGDVIQVEDTPRFQRLYLVHTETGVVKPVTPDGVQVWEFAESPGGSDFALIASAFPWEWSWYQSYVARVSAAGGSVTEVCRVERQVASPVWSPDGSQIAFLASSLSDRGSVAGGLFSVDAAGGRVHEITEGYEGSITWAEWTEPGALLCLGYEGLHATLVRLSPVGRREVLYKELVGFGPRPQARFSLAGERLAAVREDFRRSADVWVADLQAPDLAWRQVSQTNPGAANLAVGNWEVISWQAPDGASIQGILVTPDDRPQGSLPLVTIVHGGPTSLYSARVNWYWAPYLAGKGMAVLLPNPRGSTGRGLAFAEANLGDMGGGDLQEILSGIDHLVAQGVADPNRLGIAGWSYGGFMAAWAVTQTDRFKAAVVGAGITNWLSFHGTSDIPTWDARYMQANPYEGEEYRRWSPITHVARVKTPTLLLHGERDTCVPASQAYEFLRALREHGVKAHLRVYPREGHGPRERAHMKDVQNATVAWFMEHL